MERGSSHNQLRQLLQKAVGSRAATELAVEGQHLALPSVLMGPVWLMRVRGSAAHAGEKFVLRNMSVPLAFSSESYKMQVSITLSSSIGHPAAPRSSRVP